MAEKPMSPKTAFMRCFIAGVCSMLLVLLFNGPLLATHNGALPWSRDESTACDIVLLLTLLIVARHRPALIRPATFTGTAAIAATVGYGLCAFGAVWPCAGAAIAGIPFISIGNVWSIVLWLVACSTLGTRRACACLASSGAAAAPLAFVINGWAPYQVTNAMAALATVGMLVLSLPLTTDFFSRLTTLGIPAQREATHPEAFLPFGHTFYIYIFVFSVAYGFGLQCEEISSVATYPLATFVTLTGVTLYARRAKDRPRVDALFIASFSVVIAGLALLLVGTAPLNGVASALLLAGYICFDVLVWFALCEAASRNTIDAVPTICWGIAVGYLGICTGVGLWAAPEWFSALLHANTELLRNLIVAALLVSVAVYTLLTRRAFVFDTVIAGIAPDAPEVEVHYVDRLDERCDRATERYGLTARESDVMRLLAHGNNTSHIQESLGIRLNTVKYHAKNIYAKMGVHTQQELIDLVGKQD